jgi:hypothetical protein
MWEKVENYDENWNVSPTQGQLADCFKTVVSANVTTKGIREMYTLIYPPSIKPGMAHHGIWDGDLAQEYETYCWIAHDMRTVMIWLFVFIFSFERRRRHTSDKRLQSTAPIIVIMFRNQDRQDPLWQVYVPWDVIRVSARIVYPNDIVIVDDKNHMDWCKCPIQTSMWVGPDKGW